MSYYDNYNNYEEINNNNHSKTYNESGCAHQSDHLGNDYGYDSNHSYPPISPGLDNDRHHDSEYQGYQDHKNEGFKYWENKANWETDECQVLEYDGYKLWELGEWTCQDCYEEKVDQEGLRSEEHGHNNGHTPKFEGLEYSRYELEGFKHQGYKPRRAKFKGTTGGDVKNIENESQRLRFKPDRKMQGRYAYPMSHMFITTFNGDKSNECTTDYPDPTPLWQMMGSMGSTTSQPTQTPPHPSSTTTMEMESWGPLLICRPSKLTQMSAQWKKRSSETTRSHLPTMILTCFIVITKAASQRPLNTWGQWTSCQMSVW